MPKYHVKRKLQVALDEDVIEALETIKHTGASRFANMSWAGAISVAVLCYVGATEPVASQIAPAGSGFSTASGVGDERA